MSRRRSRVGGNGRARIEKTARAGVGPQGGRDLGGEVEPGDGLRDLFGGFDADGARVDDGGRRREGDGDGGERDAVLLGEKFPSFGALFHLIGRGTVFVVRSADE